MWRWTNLTSLSCCPVNLLWSSTRLFTASASERTAPYGHGPLPLQNQLLPWWQPGIKLQLQPLNHPPSTSLKCLQLFLLLLLFSCYFISLLCSSGQACEWRQHFVNSLWMLLLLDAPPNYKRDTFQEVTKSMNWLFGCFFVCLVLLLFCFLFCFFGGREVHSRGITSILSAHWGPQQTTEPSLIFSLFTPKLKNIISFCSISV